MSVILNAPFLKNNLNLFNKDALIIDDCPHNAAQLQFILEDIGLQSTIVASGERAILALEDNIPDIILLDLRMPGIGGINTLKYLKQHSSISNIPVIIVSASEDDDDLVKAFELGAHDYVCKPVQPSVLSARLRGALRLSETSKQLKSINQRLEKEASTDYLTKLYNRRHFMKLSQYEVSKAQRAERRFSLLMMDIDNFKSINDKFGHAAGDAALKILADAIRKNIRESDVAGRMGGEEFAISFPDSSPEDAIDIAERIQNELQNSHVKFEDEMFQFTVSIGVAGLTNCDPTLDKILNRSDEYLYYAKRSGKNCIVDSNSFISRSVK